MSQTHTARKARLEAILLGHQSLWRPQPFKVPTPGWCAAQPALAAEVLALGDEAVDVLAADNAALVALLARHLPPLEELSTLIATPTAAATLAPRLRHPSVLDGVPGRKQAQIEAFAATLGAPRAAMVEWCAGKGHLGRLLAATGSRPVTSLEIDATLCAEGRALAAHARVGDRQRFLRGDALAPDSARLCLDRHAVALHACGDLHTTLLRNVVAGASPGVHLVPCCYHKITAEHYRPFNATPLRLNRDDLRLAVTDTVTASASRRQLSRRAMAWKLGWVELRQALAGDADYRSFPPVPDAWLMGDFAAFIRRLAERARLALPEDTDFPHYAALGNARAARVRRLDLVRLAFRRPLEVWLLLDMAVFLERHGYAVSVASFCPSSLTPRNLLLAAHTTVAIPAIA